MKGAVVLVFFLVSFAGFGQFKYYEQGIDAYQAKDYTNAIKNLNEYLDYTLRDKSFDVEVHYYLALSYFKTQSFTSAVREFDQALELGHKNAGNIHWFMAKAYAELKVPNQSIEEYTKALPLIADKPNQAKLLFERSQQYAKIGNSVAARADLEQAVSFDKSNNDVKNALAALGKLPENTDSQKALATNQPADSRTIKIAEKDQKNDQKKQDAKIVAQKEEKKADKSVEQVAKNETNKGALDTKNAPVSNPVVNNPTPAVVVPATPTLADEFKEEKRYALVIGNASYKFVAPLKNAANDASDMAAELEKSNFEVIKVINGNYNQMRDAYRKFQEKLANGPKDQTVGLFYYAGHGLQNEGENYLVPVEANIQYEDDIPRMCFALQRVVVANMERSNSRMNIIILDACRNNPFPSAYRSGSAGLAEVKRAKGSFIGFATAPGSVASDGDGRNGLYTQELLKAMRKPGRTIEQVFKEVRLNVMKLSEEKQFTWDQSNIIGDFYFKF
jgi:tetratricopeptide (TPR) repeat protein